MTTNLITGANEGLGFETARRLVALEQGSDALAPLATIGNDGPTGTFQDSAGLVR
jgi:NAD(P)-dependent dehydrogenase (short-subunit alcohol dehydrogenase family)